jgi:acyl transferase domain-containing protein/NAD(P)-dependent dehydrogenase (short-subunit alcohol dehydrogenase family)/acyl carrier protein
LDKYCYSSERIAVVAMSCLMPDALNTGALWENITSKKVSIKELPERIFNKAVFFQPDANGKTYKNDKSYAKIGAIVDEFDFSDLGRKYRIPPAISAYFDNNQKATIYCVDQAMAQIRSSLPKERTAVILCSGAPGIKFENVVRRSFYANVENHIRNHPMVLNAGISQIDRVLKDVSNEILKDTQPVTEDTATGYLQNISAGRIANIFDFWGPSYIVDSACASSLTAISTSVAGLLNHEYDAVISGGVEVSLSEVGMIAFSGINALSPDGSYPFDKRANGFVMGLGGGIVVLKRLEDALRDGDHIYSVISGYGIGSDGKGKYIAAPSEEGQIRVIKSACKMAGYSIDTVEMLEAHGTGTAVGDVVEVSALKKAFQGLGGMTENSCGIGSIKSNVGHLRNAAGAAGLIKATLALHNKVLPATANIKEINPKLGLKGSPFYVLTENKEWRENPLHPRRANVSSYGFGGQNCHICLEEFRPEFIPKVFSPGNVQTVKTNEKSLIDMEEKMGANEEVILFSGDSAEALEKSYQAFLERSRAASFEMAVYQNNVAVSYDNEWRMAICAGSMDQLKEKWQLAAEFLYESKQKRAESLTLKGIYMGRGQRVESSRIAVMFPGQGSQYPNMLSELYNTYPVVKAFYMKAAALWKEKYNASVLPLIFNDGEVQEEVIKNTKNTHPAMFFSNMGVYKLLCEAGIKADYMIGHSLGEITSLYASGMLDLKSAINIIGERGFSFDSIDSDHRGSMVSVREKAEKVAEIIKSNGFKVAIANINSPEQTVVGGESQEINRFMEYLKEMGCKHKLLSVSHAFHTEIVSKAAEAFYEKIKDTRFHNPECNVMACHLTGFYSDIIKDSKDLAYTLKEQIISPVKFADSILKLYEEGVRVFIETGPSDVLTNLVRNILSGRDVKVVNINSKGKSSVEGFNKAIGALFAYGVEVAPVPGSILLGLQQEAGPSLADAARESIKGTASSLSVEVSSASIKGTAGTLPIQTESSAVSEKASTPAKESIVYSGVSMGLPGSFKKAFSDDNFNYLAQGKNLIEMLTHEEAQSILDLNITKLIKTEKEAVFQKISTLNEVIHFAGKFGKLDMINDYLIDEKLLNQMTQTVCAGIAAGYEALKDAGIPLVREYVKTASGSLLPKRLTLPEEMQNDTGIIFASGLYPVESVISEVSRYTAAKFGSSTRKDILNFFEAVISKVSDYESKKLLADWFALHYSRLAGNISENDVYEFNHNFLALLTSQANNRLAQLIGATGPNMFLSAACSSTSSAVTVAEDLIRAGHARRMIVLGVDITSGKYLLPWFGGAFSSIGLLTDSDSLFDAAVPFDNRRRGAILGSGAVGLIIEKEADVGKRGMNGICRILGTHAFNTAGHQIRIDTHKHCVELDRFISDMEDKYSIDRSAIANKTVYCSHETYSNKQGGCSNMEKAALENTFGEKFREIKVINTKGMTGHTLGASIEEAVSARALQYQRIPPVVNYKEQDPYLEGLNLSKGGEYEFEFVLRAVSAFGGHGNYHLLQRLAKGDDRIIDSKVYSDWIAGISSEDAVMTNYGRILVAEGKDSNIAPSSTQHDADSLKIVNSGEWSEEAYSNDCENRKIAAAKAGNDKAAAEENAEAIAEEVLAIYSDITKYPKEMLELSMEIEADLGIDTIKQATVFSVLADKFNFELSNGEALSNYPTIGHMVRLILQKAERDNLLDMTLKKSEIRESKIEENEIRENETGEGESVKPEYVSREVLELISVITKYPVEMLEDDMELEADLGIDTIKQATIFSELSEKFKLNISLNQSDFNTIKSIIGFVNSTISRAAGPIRPDNTDNSCELAESLMHDTSTKDTHISVYDTVNDIQNEDDGNYEMELCVQYPVVVEETIGVKKYDLKGKNIIIIGDDSENIHKAAGYFKKISSNVCEIELNKYKHPEELEKLMAVIKDKITIADVVFDCSHLGQSYDFSKVSLEEEKEILYLNSVSRFMFYKELQKLRPTPALRILCAVSTDGCLGFADEDSSVIDPYYGALCGFYKGLGREFRKAKVKIVDLGASGEFKWDDVIFARLQDELEEEFQLCETGYYHQKRVSIKLGNVDRSELMPVESFDSNHFVITGGGNGITAEIVRGISRKVKAKFTIIGRTKLPFNIEELSKLDEVSLDRKRIEIYDSYKKEGRKVSPAEVEREHSQVIKAISVYRLLKEIRSNGSDAQYFSCDVTDHPVLKAALQKAASAFGPANVIIHGAGVEKSKLIGQKTKEDFEEVFEVKANGLCNLFRLADNKELRVFMGFSSISGRFGNEAQLDYCAGNNFISSFMSVIKSHNKKLRAVSISWSGWKDTGMAWRNEIVKRNSEEMGLHFIEPDRGTNEFLNILMSNINRDEIVVSKGLGSLSGNKKWQDIKNTVPLIDWVSKKDGEIQKIYKVLSVKTDPIINHHRLGKTPLMPAVGFMEIGAQAHSLLYGRKEQYCFKDVKLDNPLKLFNEKSQEIIMIPGKTSSGDLIDAVFYNNFKPKFGKGTMILLNSMRISAAIGEYEHLRNLRLIESNDMVEMGLRDSLESTAKSLSNAISLGSLFMDEQASKINRFKCNRQGIVSTIALSEEQLTNKKYNLRHLLINPAFADSLMQSCGIHSSVDTDGVYLPWKIGEFGVVKVPREPGLFKAFAEMTRNDGVEKTYDVILYGDNGEIYYYAKNVIVKRIAK